MPPRKTPSKSAQVPVSRAEIPCPDAFRGWLSESLARLELSTSAYGRACGLGKNTLGRFLATEGRDIRLGTAAGIVRDLQARAAEAGTALPPLPAGLVAGGGHAA